MILLTLISIIAAWALLTYTTARQYFSRIHWPIQKSVSVLILLGMLILLYITHLHFKLLYYILGLIILAYGWSYHEKNITIPGTPDDHIRFIFSNIVNDSFAVIFWFVIFGPVGVLVYDMARQKFNKQFNWIPSRVLGLGYALAGHFPSAFRYWKQNKRNSSYSVFLEECGICALSPDKIPSDIDSHKAESLVSRAQIMLFIVLALIALGQLL